MTEGKGTPEPHTDIIRAVNMTSADWRMWIKINLQNISDQGLLDIRHIMERELNITFDAVNEEARANEVDARYRELSLRALQRENQQRDELQRKDEALRYYASREAYQPSKLYEDSLQIEEDGGNLARAALTPKQEGEEG